MDLFFISFLSATLLPGTSEIYLSYLLYIEDQPLSSFYLLLVATLGNTLGAMTNWYLGFVFARHYLERKIRQKKFRQAQQWIHKYGVYALIFSWMPIIGDLLCIVAGIYKLSIVKSIIVIFTAKFSRYFIILLLVKFYDTNYT